MDNTNLSAVTWPPLTTVDLGSAERARIAAELLLARIEHPGAAPRIVGVEPRLVVRASCGASRMSDGPGAAPPDPPGQAAAPPPR